MSNKEMLDKIFDSVLYEALKEVESEPNPDLPEEMDIEFSERHKANMKKLFDTEKKKIWRRKLYHSIKYAAAGFVILVIATSIMVMSVSALRIRVLNFLVDMQNTNTEMTVRDDADGNGYQIGSMQLGYIPDGFDLEEQNTIKQEMYLKFKNSKQESIFIVKSESSGVYSVDTEGASVEKITINDTNALYSQNENNNILTMWSDDGIITIKSTISRDEIIKIAQNIKIN